MNANPNFSSLWLALLALTAGLSLLVAGGDFLVSGASKLARRIGMSPLLVGLTVVAFGTSMPEMFVSIIATLQNHPNIMFGNVIGSNIANIGLVLAISAMIKPLPIEFHRLSTEFYLVIAASFIVIGAAFFNTFPRVLGLLFSTSLFVYTWYSYKSAPKNGSTEAQTTNPNESDSNHTANFSILSLCFIGIILLGFGSNLFIDGAVDLARYFGISELVIGLTLAAVGTSLPELASCISAIRKNENDILVGNILGSNLFNLLLVLGFTAIIKPFQIPGSTLVRDLPVMALFSLVLIPAAIYPKKISRVMGFSLLAAYVFYIYLIT